MPIEFEWRLTFFSFQLALCTFSTPQPTIVAIWTTLAVVTQAKPKLKPKLFIPSAIKHWLLYNLAYKIDTWSTNKVFLFCETFVWKYISTYCPRQFKVQIPTGLDHNKWSFYRQLSRGCLVVVGTFFRYIGLSANRQAKNSYFAKWPLEAARWSGVNQKMLMDWKFDFGAVVVVVRNVSRIQ